MVLSQKENGDAEGERRKSTSLKDRDDTGEKSDRGRERERENKRMNGTERGGGSGGSVGSGDRKDRVRNDSGTVAE